MRVSVPDTAPHWNDALAALQRYQSQRGTTDVGPNIRAYGIDLGKWVARCRDEYWDGILDLDHLAALEAVTGWHWGPPRPGSWRHGHDALATFARQSGTTRMLAGTVVDGVDLHAWVTAQRQAFTGLELSAPQIRLLAALPEWDWDIETARWDHGIAAATAWIAEHHTLASVQRDTRLADYPLGQWLHRCREDFRAGTLLADRVAELEALPGWSWGRHHDSWEEGLRVLRAYLAETGHACPPQKTVFDGHPIGWWVTHRRREHRNGTLPVDRAELLAALPGWRWTPTQDRWQEGLDALTTYVSRHGAATPGRSDTVDGYPLGAWVNTQKSAHKAGRLPADRAAKLAALPGWRWRT
ncbi:putative helicase [Mycolicibacterium sp. TY66]|nr:putative helicase [Mycolicibacterium sp. TY66]BCJ84175.1 putative helicase [Mycolicibacterium sp. TY81]